ncbi:hypothetical protein MIR68_001423 [Amoeboaphelidium protococcarum]|nr:hypothetical protein MIR68_001423 [Amoeboaphelidium protococcarum]
MSILERDLTHLKWSISKNPRWKNLSVASIVTQQQVASSESDALKAFMRVITASDVNGQLTLLALQSIDRFIQSQHFNNNCMPLLGSILASVVQCKFEASDSNVDECVLLAIMQVLLHGIEVFVSSSSSEMLFPNGISSAVAVVGDALVCAIMETIFSILYQTRLSDVLRKSAELNVIQIFKLLVRYLESQDVAVNEQDAIGQNDAQVNPELRSRLSREDFVHISNQTEEQHAVANEQNARDNASSSSATEDAQADLSQQSQPLARGSIPDLAAHIEGLSAPNDQAQLQETALLSSASARFRESNNFSVHSVQEIFRFLVSMMESSQSDNAKTISLSVLCRIVEDGADVIERDLILMNLFRQDLFKNLLLLVRSSLININVSMLGLTLKCVCTLRIFTFLDAYHNFTVHMLISFLQDTLPMSIVQNKQKQVRQLLSKYNCIVSSQQVDGNLGLDQLLEDLPNMFAFTYKMFAYNPNITDPRDMILDALAQLLQGNFCHQLFAQCDCVVTGQYVYQALITTLCQLTIMPYLIQEIQIGSFDSYMRLTKNDRDRYERAGEVIPASMYRSVSIKAFDLLQQLLQQEIQRFSSIDVASIRMLQLQDHTQVLELLNMKKEKMKMIEAANNFNQNPSQGLELMMKIGLLSDLSPQSVAKICHVLPLNKKVLGEFLSKPKNFDVLKEFMNNFDWSNIATPKPRMDQALRSVLQKFRLPGEAQQIQRVVEAFSDGYFEQCLNQDAQLYYEQHGSEENYKSQEALPLDPDAVFVLAYAIIMLNTDQHNPQVRKRMTAEDFRKNLRQTNSKGRNFLTSYLDAIYESIKENEILMPEEHEGDVGFEHLVNEIATYRSSASTRYPLSPQDSIILDKVLFDQYWQILSTTVLYYYHSSDTQANLHQSIKVYNQLCQLSFTYGNVLCTDGLLISMFQSSNLLLSSMLSQQNVEVALDSITFAELYKDIGEYKVFRKKRNRLLLNLKNDVHAQVSCLISFRNLSEYKLGVNSAWIYVLDILSHFYLLDIIMPKNLLTCINIQDLQRIECQSTHIIGKKTIGPQLASSKKVSGESNSSGSGFLSALQTFLLSSADSSGSNGVNGDEEYQHPPLTAEEKEAEAVCLEIVNECKIAQLFDSGIDDCLENFVHAALAIITPPSANEMSLPQQDLAQFLLLLLLKVLQSNVSFIKTAWVNYGVGESVANILRIRNLSSQLFLFIVNFIVTLSVKLKDDTELCAEMVQQLLTSYLQRMNVDRDHVDLNEKQLQVDALQSVWYLFEQLQSQDRLETCLRPCIDKCRDLIKEVSVLQVQASADSDQLPPQSSSPAAIGWEIMQVILKALKLHPLSAKQESVKVSSIEFMAITEMLGFFVTAPQRLQNESSAATTVTAGSISSKLHQAESRKKLQTK